MTIWKFPIPIEDDFTLEMPSEAEVLSVQVQNGQACIWALVHPDNPPELRSFSLRGTGHPAAGEEFMRFIGTFQIRGGALVFHLFEVIP